MFSGVYTALITPFKGGGVDFNALGKLIEYQCEHGVDGIAPCGTTGESSTLSYEEHEAVIDFCVKSAKNRIKVLAGTGSNSTSEAVHFTQFAKKVGCDGVLVVSPYYNKPTQRGLYLHFKSVAEVAADMPVVLYNIAGRTSVNIEPSTVAALFNDCKNIVGVKEASGSLTQASAIKSLAPDIELFSGDDALTLPFLSVGGTGVVSVVSNIVPFEVISLVKAFKKGNIGEAIKIHYRLLPLIRMMFVETNPIPVKTAAFLLGMCQEDLRLPMCEMEVKNRTELEKTLKFFCLLK